METMIRFVRIFKEIRDAFYVTYFLRLDYSISLTRTAVPRKTYVYFYYSTLRGFDNFAV